MAKQKSTQAGYSGTPLIQKLGIKSGFEILVVNAPKEYAAWLGPLPEKAKIIKRAPESQLDFIHVFADDQRSYEEEFVLSKQRLKKSGILWISWPKKSSGMATDLTDKTIREFGLSNGLVDVKVCAVSEVWSGLKFVFRLKDR